YLFLSIISSSTIYLLFKWSDRLKIRVFQAIVINYLTALFIGIWAIPDKSQAFSAAALWPEWTVAGLLMGGVFISIFYLMALTSQKVGVSVTTIASKMSLALAALLFVWVDPNERLHLWKIVALALALGGVIMSSWRADGSTFHWRTFIWPLLILFGSTAIDFVLAHYATHPQTINETKLYSCLSFGTAAMVGVIALLVSWLRQGHFLSLSEIGFGVLLGTVNYGSIYFLIMAYDAEWIQKSELLPINNLGVVLTSSIAAIFLFKEKLSTKNWIGLGMSICSLILLLLTSA
ncbi:MAG: EamA family transporter, partial [Flavobacteriales bacterium]